MLTSAMSTHNTHRHHHRQHHTNTPERCLHLIVLCDYIIVHSDLFEVRVYDCARLTLKIRNINNINNNNVKWAMPEHGAPLRALKWTNWIKFLCSYLLRVNKINEKVSVKWMNGMEWNEWQRKPTEWEMREKSILFFSWTTYKIHPAIYSTHTTCYVRIYPCWETFFQNKIH